MRGREHERIDCRDGEEIREGDDGALLSDDGVKLTSICSVRAPHRPLPLASFRYRCFGLCRGMWRIAGPPDLALMVMRRMNIFRVLYCTLNIRTIRLP